MFQVMKETINRMIMKKSNTHRIENPAHKEIRRSTKLTKNLEQNIQMLQALLGDSDDIVLRHLEIHTSPNIKAAVLFIENLIDMNRLETSVLSPLTQGLAERSVEERRYLHAHIEKLLTTTLSNCATFMIENLEDAVDSILSGNGILLVHNYSKTLSFNLSKDPPREYAEPLTEKVVKGPQQGFVEDLSANISLIRKRIRSNDLVVKGFAIGRKTKSQIKVVYINGIANEGIVTELYRRLNRIDIDGIVGSSMIEEYITDTPTNLFQTTFYTERPDRVTSMLLEGRIAILYEGSPFVIMVPSILSDFFISADDYYEIPYFANFSRFIAYLGAIMMTFLPSIYVAATTFHQEMLPTSLALTIAGARFGVPFPAYVEALIMEIAFEALRQAGTRLPTHVGQAVSIVGALIIGQAAVEAGLVSSAVVIVVATTAIFSFTIPYTNFSLSLRLVRFFMMTLAATLGIYGIISGTLILVLNLISLRSFGVPFMIPFAPLSLYDMQDWFLRFPQWAITKRSSYISPENINKKAQDLKPYPPTNEEERKL